MRCGNVFKRGGAEEHAVPAAAIEGHGGTSCGQCGGLY
jgi:hypothetical protein